MWTTNHDKLLSLYVFLKYSLDFWNIIKLLYSYYKTICVKLCIMGDFWRFDTTVIYFDVGSTGWDFWTGASRIRMDNILLKI